MVKGECFLRGAHSLALSCVPGEGLFTWNPKSTEAEGSREENSWCSCGICQLLGHSEVSSPRECHCHLSSAWSRGCSVEAAMNTKISSPSIPVLYLPHKSQSLLKNTDRLLLLLSVGTQDLLSNSNKSQLESSILKSCSESSVLSMTKIWV